MNARKSNAQSNVEMGRPYSPETHSAILEAVPKLLSQMRYSDLTFDKIAKEAGVGKAAIFRRWNNKAELVTESLRLLFEKSNPGLPDNGDDEKNLRIFIKNTAQMLVKSGAGAIIKNLISELEHEPKLAALISEFESERRNLIFKLIEPLHSKVDRNVLVSMLFGPLYFRWLMTGEKINERFIDDCVDLVLISSKKKRGS